jgi:two-component sensor histidine kinase/ligand-binding sensor domain-containing protein
MYNNPKRKNSRIIPRILSIRNIFLLIFATLNLSASLFAVAHNIKFENVSIEQGLSQSTVNCILQDSRGFIWLGTEDGLNKYDGYGFIIYKSDPLDSNSLSDSYVLAVFEDKSGVLWVGTHTGGLNKFDREKEKFTQYKNDPSNPDSLSSNFVNAIYEDTNGVLWIGTYGGGLCRFDRDKERIRSYRYDPSDPNSLSSSSVNTIYEDRSGVLWIGTTDGLNKLIPGAEEGSSPTFLHYKLDTDDFKELSNNIRSIYEDHAGVLWIGTDYGLYRLIPDTKGRSSQSFIHYRNNPVNPRSLSNNNIRSILEDRTRVLWIGTYGGGINRFDREKEQFEHLVNEPGNPSSLSNNFVNTIYEDRTGILWIGTFGGGIDRFDRDKEKFMHYRSEPNNPNSLNNDTVFSIYEERAGILWIGTYGGGLTRFDREKGIFKHYIHDSHDPNSISNNNVRCIHKDRSGMLWVGTYDGLNRFDREKEKFIHYKHDPGKPNSLSNNYIRTIFEDRSGILWIGTIEGGLNKLVSGAGEGSRPAFIRYAHDPNDPDSLSNNRVYTVYEDRSDRLWIGTAGGLNRLVPGTEEGASPVFVRYRHIPDKPDSLSNDRVFSIYEDRTGAFWVGTYGGGLNKFVPGTEEGASPVFIHYKEKDGLPNDVIYAILEDNKGNLWLSTNKGLSKFNPQTETFRNYDVNDGLQSNEFNSGAYYRSQSGEMFFGGINGFNAFYPDSIRDNPYIPPVVITNFQVFNKSVPIDIETDGPSILEKSITETEAIELSYKDRVFSFEFAALHYASPDKNEYAYMMEGFDRDWNYVGNRHFATYTNLSPGDYVFKVKGSNNDGVWNEEGTVLKIKVTPPFWDTWWFITLSVLVGLTLVYELHRYRTRLLHHRAKNLEKKVKERTSDLTLINERLKKEITERKEAEERIKASLKEKEVMLQEIHHRVKNNLQVISSLLKLQSRYIKDEKILEIFKESQTRIRSMALIHNKLYQSKDMARIDFADYIHSLSTDLFRSYRVSSSLIRMKINTEDVFLDINSAIPCGLIISELISNALKHAFPNGRKGELTIDFSQEKDKKFKLVVADNGVGFPEDLDFRNTESLGMRLICILTEQLQGTVELDKKNGTKFEIKF